MLVDRAIDENLIGVDRPLFVVGAGAGGVTAALYSAFRGVKTTIIELRDHAFALQRKCLTRWIDPTQYDWPASHWIQGIFPWVPPAMPLPWRAFPSNLIAATWTQELRSAIKKYPGLLQVKFKTKVVSATIRQPQQDLEVRYEEETVPGTFLPAVGFYGAAIFAKGHGTEKATIGSYKSFDFWDTDNFEQPNLGLPVRSAPHRYNVLICGGGDGALQDFLRITTGKGSASDIMHRIWSFIPLDLVLSLFTEEDQAHRAGIWNTKGQNHPVLERLDQSHRQYAQQLLRPPSGPAIIAELQSLLLHAESLNVTLIHPCTHFSQSYPLNRFLVYLVSEYARAASLPITIKQQTSASSVRGISHTCSKPSSCHGQEHEVYFDSAPACDTMMPTSPYYAGRYEAIVLRAGVAPPVPFNALRNPLFARHSLPYHAPA